MTGNRILGFLSFILLVPEGNKVFRVLIKSFLSVFIVVLLFLFGLEPIDRFIPLVDLLLNSKRILSFILIVWQLDVLVILCSLAVLIDLELNIVVLFVLIINFEIDSLFFDKGPLRRRHILQISDHFFLTL